MLHTCRDELVARGQPAAEEMEVGIMVEVPSAALIADHLAAEVDFFSIGTNDLSQYTMAADRTNARVAALATGYQPAVLRLVREVIAAAHAQDKWVGLCGELAGEPLAVPILLGLGLDEFSVSPPAIPLVKQTIRALSLDEARAVAQQALALESAEAIRELVQARVPAANVG
jgi:phosphoenolpyruvate-protein kinase (PTS system EI component)